MKSPSPEPPYLTCVRLDAWTKRWNRLFFSSSVSPSPVSLTSNIRKMGFPRLRGAGWSHTSSELSCDRGMN